MQVDGPHVVVANSSGKLEVHAIRLGRDYGRHVSVVEGVQGDERLVVNPTDDLRSGTPVAVESDVSSTSVAKN
jgi:hypothetical protein